MSSNFEVREGLRLLEGLENGTLSSADAYTIADKRDPVLLYFILRYLREKYPAGKPTSQGVVQRVVELTSTYDDVVKKAKAGEQDSMREWFDDAYAMRDYFDRSSELVEMIVDKLES
jgi:hypothetical protein